MSTGVNMGSGVIAALVANTDLIALGLTAANIWSKFGPQTVSSAGPWIVCSRIDQDNEGSQDGDDGLERARFQLTIACTDGVVAESIQRVISRQFNGLDFPYVENSVSYLLHFFQRNSNDTPWEPDVGIHKLSTDLEVWMQT